MSSSDLNRVVTARQLAASGRAKEIRVKSQLPIGEMAAALGVPASTVWRWEAGRVLPRGDRAVRYAKILAALERGQKP